jgi:uncharacterized protein (DUF1330 family)
MSLQVLRIKDAVRFEDYRRMLLPTMAKYGAQLVARGGPIKSSLCFVPNIADHLIRKFGVKTRDTQTIHRASVPWYPFLLFTGHYGATGAL